MVPADALQLVVNEVCVRFVPAVATGANGVATTVVMEIMFELPLVPPALLPLTR